MFGHIRKHKAIIPGLLKWASTQQDIRKWSPEHQDISEKL